MSTNPSQNSNGKTLEARARAEGIVRSIRLPIQSFIHTEEIGAVALLLSAVAALVWVNSAWSESYHQVWETNLSIDLGIMAIDQDLRHWINDGLMALFFFVLGLEVKREIVRGEIANFRHAALPVTAAIGGWPCPPSST